MKFLDKVPKEFAPQAKRLLDEGGPVIQYRTLKDIIMRPASCGKLKNARTELADDPLVQKYLGYMNTGDLMRNVHGSKNRMLENIFGKLMEFGLRAGHKPIDLVADYYLAQLEKSDHSDGTSIWPDWLSRLVASSLNMMGYRYKFLVDYSCRLIDRMCEIVEEGKFDDFYVSYEGYPSPGSYGKTPLINPRFYEGSSLAVPWVYDLLGFAYSPWLRRRGKYCNKVEYLVEFVLSDTYQSFRPGFGALYIAEGKKYYMQGWSVHLRDQNDKPMRDHLVILEALSKFRSPWKNERFLRELEWIDSFKTGDGYWEFPKEFLTEGEGYWVGGGRMALEGPPRTAKKLKLESTCRALVIHRGKP